MESPYYGEEDYEEDVEFIIKDELIKMVEDFKKSEPLSAIPAVLIQRGNLNRMIVDLYDYDKGYDLSFFHFEEEEKIFHGRYAYGVALTEYVGDGEIPYEIYELIRNYEFQILYDGYVFCELIIHFDQKDSERSHFVMLRHTIQTINKECQMRCEADDNLDFETERAKLIEYYSPDLCLDPDPTVAEIVIANELNQHPFVTPYLRHFIQNEKAKREMGVFEHHELSKKKKGTKENINLKVEKKEEDWSLNFKKTSLNIDDISLEPDYKTLLINYLKERPLCFPDEKSYTGSHIEIENFVFEYPGRTRSGKRAHITDKLCIAVRDDKEFFYGGYKLDKRMNDYVPFYWWEMGNRMELDLYIAGVGHEEFKLTLGGMKVTHNRLFHEEAVFCLGKTKIVRQKLKVPATREVLHNPWPPFRESEEGSGSEEGNDGNEGGEIEHAVDNEETGDVGCGDEDVEVDSDKTEEVKGDEAEDVEGGDQETGGEGRKTDERDETEDEEMEMVIDA